jgi:hypothetical protein
MNGTVSCSGCDYDDLYLNALAHVMTPVDPLPDDFTQARTKKQLLKEKHEIAERERRASEQKLSSIVRAKVTEVVTSLRRMSRVIALPARQAPARAFSGIR